MTERPKIITRPCLLADLPAKLKISWKNKIKFQFKRNMAVISNSLLTEIFGMVFFIFSGVYIYFRYFVYNYWRKKGVAYVEPTIPAGNLTRVLGGKIFLGEIYAEAYAEQKKNRYFGMYAFNKPTLVLAELDLIKYVLTKEFDHFHDRGLYSNEKIDPLSGHLFLQTGTKWRNLRTKLTPTFTSGKIKQMFATIVDTGEKLAIYLKPKAEKRQIVELKDLFARFSTDIIMSTVFGISCNSINNPDSEFRRLGQKAVEARPWRNTLSLCGPKILEFFSIPFTDRAVTKFFMRTFKETMEYRKTNNVTRPDFMNLIMQLMNRGYVDCDNDEDTSSIAEVSFGKITELEGAAQAFVFFVAGFETTSATITYCLYELACNQDIQDRVMTDIDSALEKFGRLIYESLWEMTYLQKVISETLRKYPTVAFLNRVCTKDINLPTTSLHVSKGLDVLIPVLGIHKDPQIYPNPDVFDPERFNEENIASRHPCAYLPFGDGPRTCIGMRFAYAQIKVALVSTLAKYRVRLGPNTPVPLEYDPGVLVLTSKGGIELIVEPR